MSVYGLFLIKTLPTIVVGGGVKNILIFAFAITIAPIGGRGEIIYEEVVVQNQFVSSGFY